MLKSCTQLFLCKMFTHPIHSFPKVSFGNNVFNSYLDLKCLKCRGCEHCPGVWNKAKRPGIKVQWPGIKAMWLRGACRGQAIHVWPCSNLSFCETIPDKRKSCLFLKKNLPVREILLLPEASCSGMHFPSFTCWYVAALRSWTGLNLGSPTWLFCCDTDGFCLNRTIHFWRFTGAEIKALVSYVKHILGHWKQNEEGPPVTLSSKYLQGKLMDAEISATTTRTQSSMVVRQLAAQRGVNQPCEIHLLAFATGSAGKVVEGQVHFPWKTKLNRWVPAAHY